MPLGIKIGASVMQGRRHVQEDRHIVLDDLYAYALKNKIQVANEDIQNLLKQSLLLGVFDGHMGNRASTFCCQHLPLAIVKDMAQTPLLFSQSKIKTKKRKVEASCAADCLAIDKDTLKEGLNPSEIGRILLKCFHDIDHQFAQKFRLRKDGSTGLIVLVMGFDVFIAWVGDSRAVLGSRRELEFKTKLLLDYTPDPHFRCIKQPSYFLDCGDSVDSQWKPELVSSALSVDHKPDRPDEAERICKSGGEIIQANGVTRVVNPASHNRYNWLKSRINTHFLGFHHLRQPTALAVSRAFGDNDLKSSEHTKIPILIATPELRHFQIEQDLDKFIILGCDGIWDVLTNQQAVDVANKAYDTEDKDQVSSKIASALVKTAFQKGSQDNLTSIVMSFQKIIAAV